MWVLSFLLVAFGQAVFHPAIATVAAICGYALFWTKRRPFWLAWLFGAGVQAVQLSWLAAPHYHGYFIVVAYALICISMGLLFAFFNHYVREKYYSSLHGCAALAGLWVLIEWARLFLLCGFAWNHVGIALGATLWGRQLASVGGVLALSFAVMFINLLAVRAYKLRQCKAALHWVLIACIPFGYGAWRMANDDPKTGRALLVQTGLYPEQKFPLAPELGTFVGLEEQWGRALAHVQPADWIIFPESTFPFGAHRQVLTQQQVDRLLHKHFKRVPSKRKSFWTNIELAQEVALVTGSEVIMGLDDGDYNAAFHISPEGSMMRWEKMRLLPIAECLPFQWLKPLAERYGIDGVFLPGESVGVAGDRVPLSVSICYDECFSSLVRQGRSKGARLLVNLSNDAWYPHTRLNRTQFEHGLLRSVENGVPLLRACNTGVTAAVDGYGRILGTIAGEEASSLLVDVPLTDKKTFYARFGDMPLIFLCFALGISFLLRCLKKSQSATLVNEYQ